LQDPGEGLRIPNPASSWPPKLIFNKLLGFQRSGLLGFGAIALGLMDDTISKFEEALGTYRW
jgi:hypothetical protein